jgi:hypothetical protein
MVVPSLVEVLFCDEAGNHMQYVHMQSARNRVHSACNQHAISMQSRARLTYYSLSIHSTCNHMQSHAIRDSPKFGIPFSSRPRSFRACNHNAITCNQRLTQIWHPFLVEAEELQSVVNAPDDEGGNQQHSDTIRQPPDALRPPSRARSRARPGDNQETVRRCTFQGVPSRFRPADGVGYA